MSSHHPESDPSNPDKPGADETEEKTERPRILQPRRILTRWKATSPGWSPAAVFRPVRRLRLKTR